MSTDDERAEATDGPIPRIEIRIHREHFGTLAVGNESAGILPDSEPYVYVERTSLDGSVTEIRMSRTEARLLIIALTLVAPDDERTKDEIRTWLKQPEQRRYWGDGGEL